jgi:hypothetical protein
MMELTIPKATSLCCKEFDAFTRGHREHVKDNAQKALDPSTSTLDLLEWISCQKTKLDLFADVLGVFAKSNLSVEHRLRANPAARNAVLQLLRAILNNTRFCTKYTHDGSKMELEEAQVKQITSSTHIEGIDDQASTSVSGKLYELALQRISRDIANLLGFAASIRTRSMQQYKERSKNYVPQDQDGVDLVPYFRKVVDKALEERYTDSRILEHETLERRIKNTIFSRWLRLCYSIHRYEQLQSSGITLQTADEEPQHSGRNSDDGADNPKGGKPAAHNVNDSGNDVAATHEATTFSGSLYPRVQEHQAQSPAPSVALTTAGGSNARIPRLKQTKTVCDGEILDFLCPLCRLPQQLNSGVHKHEQHRAWKYVTW